MIEISFLEVSESKLDFMNEQAKWSTVYQMACLEQIFGEQAPR